VEIVERIVRAKGLQSLLKSAKLNLKANIAFYLSSGIKHFIGSLTDTVSKEAFLSIKG